MADYALPDDLLQLQRDFYRTDALCAALSASHPKAVDVVAGVADITEEQRGELEQAHAERLAVVEALQTHPWWAEADEVLAAKAALRATVKAESVESSGG